MKLVITCSASIAYPESFDMLFNTEPQGNRLMIRLAASTGRAGVTTGMAAIPGIATPLRDEPSSVIFDEFHRGKYKEIFASIPQPDLNKSLRLMVSDSV